MPKINDVIRHRLDRLIDYHCKRLEFSRYIGANLSVSDLASLPKREKPNKDGRR